jgi:hypothetical protein
LQTELARWEDVLDKCDAVLEKAAQSKSPDSYQLMVDSLDAVALRNATIIVLKFTALLFENTFTRSMYSSADVRLHFFWINRLFMYFFVVIIEQYKIELMKTEKLMKISLL